METFKKHEEFGKEKKSWVQEYLIVCGHTNQTLRNKFIIIIKVYSCYLQDRLHEYLFFKLCYLPTYHLLNQNLKYSL